MSSKHLSFQVVNGFTSMMRNIFLTSSIGFAVMGFSRSFKEYKKSVEVFAYSIFIFSIIYGLTAANEFKHYLQTVENIKDLTEKDRVSLGYWYIYDYLAYVYCCMLVIFVIMMFKRDFMS